MKQRGTVTVRWVKQLVKRNGSSGTRVKFGGGSSGTAEAQAIIGQNR